MLKIVIKTDHDLTPEGKRTVKVVKSSRGRKKHRPVIRWYVGGRVYRTLELENDNIDLSQEWLKGNN